MELEEIVPFIGKDVHVHFKEGDKGTKEVDGEIKAANIAGVPFKQKGKAGVDLYTPDDFYEIALAPAKEKSVTQKKLKPIPEGQMRQHLADRHGVSLKWCKDASEIDAVLYHDGDGTEANPGIDHSDCGHKHVAEAEKSDERTEALAGTPEPVPA